MPTIKLKSHSSRKHAKKPIGHKAPPRTDAVATEIRSRARWTRLSKQIRTERPLCQRCEENGILIPSQEVHHIRKAETHPHLAYDPGNLRALCKPCHLIEERDSK
ncbi:MAG: HNH endonuclease [Gammaproteobacteria bacterium]|nr:HNH endonuclease [Gammaproteobacteria bacterium]